MDTSDFTIDGTGLIIRPTSRVVFHRHLNDVGAVPGVVVEIGQRLSGYSPDILVRLDPDREPVWMSTNNIRRADDEERLPSGIPLWSYL